MSDSLKDVQRPNFEPDDKIRHFENLLGIVSEPHWESVRVELEDALLRAYGRFDGCNTVEEFFKIQGEVVALKRLYGLKDLATRFAKQRTGIRAPIKKAQNLNEETF